MSEFSRKRAKGVVGEMRASLEDGEHDDAGRKGLSGLDFGVIGAAAIAVAVAGAVRMGYLSGPDASGVTARLGEAFSFSTSTAAPSTPKAPAVARLLSDPDPLTQAAFGEKAKPEPRAEPSRIAAVATPQSAACVTQGATPTAQLLGGDSGRAAARAMDEALLCRLASAGARLCESGARQPVVDHINIYLQRGALARRFQTALDRGVAGGKRDAAAQIASLGLSPEVVEAIRGQIRSGRLTRSDFRKTRDELRPDVERLFDGLPVARDCR
ncbi:MAG: hypothetical protein IPL88_07795 [Rhizobiales bacterium]|nr:hypothetical protein [Hyphomicrobiales bacterium]